MLFRSTVTFAGLGRPPGGHDNVQVTAYGNTPIYCKAVSWDAASSDLVVSVRCFRRDALLVDSKFTILAIGARPFGASTPIGFLRSNGDTGTVLLDTAVTARNSAGGQIATGHGMDAGFYSIQWTGLGAQSGGAAGPVGIIAASFGFGARRCSENGYDLAGGGLGITCRNSFGGLVDGAFSALWFTRGRPGLRYGFALANNATNTIGYTPSPETSANSSRGAITAKRTGTGTYQIVFAGLAHAAGAAESVQVAAFGGGPFCTLVSWGNSGANDLVANVDCWDTFDAPVNTPFTILIVQ